MNIEKTIEKIKKELNNSTDISSRIIQMNKKKNWIYISRKHIKWWQNKWISSKITDTNKKKHRKFNIQ